MCYWVLNALKLSSLDPLTNIVFSIFSQENTSAPHCSLLSHTTSPLSLVSCVCVHARAYMRTCVFVCVCPLFLLVLDCVTVLEWWHRAPRDCASNLCVSTWMCGWFSVHTCVCLCALSLSQCWALASFSALASGVSWGRWKRHRGVSLQSEGKVNHASFVLCLRGRIWPLYT